MTGTAIDSPYPSICSLAEAYLSGKAKPSRVVRAHLDRIESLDPTIGAFQVVYPEDAMRAAEAADQMFASGLPLGPFHGIPFGLKDICEVEGRITTGGSKAMQDRVSSVTGSLSRRLFAAGGIMLGKTKTVECAFGAWGTNQRMGTPWNPWDLGVHRVPGGSSSGTGASVASGMAVCGVGTDTGGSVRLPAGFCGLVGLKVTEGRLPTDGILPLSHTLDTPGPLARSVEDATLMFLVMNAAEGWSVERDRRESKGLFAELRRGVQGLRLGILDATERAACTVEVLEGYDAALDLLRKLGAVLVPFSAQKSYSDLTTFCGELIAAEGYFHHGHMYAQTDLPMDDDVRTRMLAGSDLSAASYMKMLRDRIAGREAFLDQMRGFDGLLTPTTTTTAPPVSEVDQAVSPGHFTRHVNYLGLCALSVPSGLSPSGLPTSLQVVARPNAEGMALRVGAAYEGARGAFAYPDLN